MDCTSNRCVDQCIYKYEVCRSALLLGHAH